MNDSKTWLKQTSARAKALSHAHKHQLRRLWWVNLILVVSPAVLSTAAAVFGALPEDRQPFTVVGLPAAAAFAGAAAILLAVHKALKCDDYQAECLRLSQEYQSKAIDADSANSRPVTELDGHQKRLTTELVELTKNAKAQVRRSFMNGDDNGSKSPDTVA